MSNPKLSDEIVLARLAASPEMTFQIDALVNLLLFSEYRLILFMAGNQRWQGNIPPRPAKYDVKSAHVELGVLLFLLNNVNYIQDPSVRADALTIRKYFTIPASQFTGPNYSWIMQNVLIFNDGSVLSGGTWETYDQGWFAAFINLLNTTITYRWYNDGTLPSGTPAVVQLQGAVANQVTIGIVGDWGTGDAAAQAVISQLQGLNPDYAVHLGDVYYSGSPIGILWDAIYYYTGEETNFLLNCWPQQWAGKSFTLNSNHEMYTGANGLFRDALVPSNTQFSAQNGLTYFALQYGDFTILGLDSAYYGSITNAFMDGTLGDPSNAQVQWIKSLKLDPKKVIVFTHHTGFVYDCSAVEGLWAEVNAALGGDPFAWYWGHVHNGIVYKQPVTVPGLGPNNSSNTYTRCAGHSGLPYAAASTLYKNPEVIWAVNSTQPGSKLLYNGFVTLTFEINNNNVVTDITEIFYDTSSAYPKFLNHLL